MSQKDNAAMEAGIQSADQTPIAQPVAPEQETITRPPITRIESLRELTNFTEIVNRIAVRLEIAGQVWEIEGRRLTPREEAQLDEMIMSLVPPIKKGAKPEDDAPDMLNPEFLRKRAILENKIRSLTLYWSIPIIHEIKPGLKDAAEIDRVVQEESKLTSEILGALYQAVRSNSVRDLELVNFTTSTP